MAIIRSAPATNAELTAAIPIPPQPKIATVSPALTLAVFTIAPNPVMIEQPISAALSRGMSFLILTIAFS